MSSDDWGFTENEDLTQVTVKELDSMIDRSFALEGQLDTLKLEQKKIQDEIDKLEAKIIFILQKSGKKTYPTDKGSVTVVERVSVKIPREPGDREAFFNYLKSKGIFQDMITVNSNTLNAYYKAEFEAAKQENRASEFSVPGIGAPTVSETLSKKPAKKY